MLEPGLLIVSLEPSDAALNRAFESDLDRRAELHDIVHSDARTGKFRVVGRKTALACRSASGTVTSLRQLGEKTPMPSSSCVQTAGLD